MKNQIIKTIATIVLSVGVFMWVVTRPYAEPPTLTASYYGKESKGLTSCGEYFDGSSNTCAVWEIDGKPIPMHSLLKLTLGPNSVITRVNDRGPNKRLLKSRQIDVSEAVFRKLNNNDTSAGLIKVKVEILRLGK